MSKRIQFLDRVVGTWVLVFNLLLLIDTTWTFVTMQRMTIILAPDPVIARGPIVVIAYLLPIYALQFLSGLAIIKGRWWGFATFAAISSPLLLPIIISFSYFIDAKDPLDRFLLAFLVFRLAATAYSLVRITMLYRIAKSCQAPPRKVAARDRYSQCDRIAAVTAVIYSLWKIGLTIFWRLQTNANVSLAAGRTEAWRLTPMGLLQWLLVLVPIALGAYGMMKAERWGFAVTGLISSSLLLELFFRVQSPDDLNLQVMIFLGKLICVSLIGYCGFRLYFLSRPSDEVFADPIT